VRQPAGRRLSESGPPQVSGVPPDQVHWDGTVAACPAAGGAQIDDRQRQAPCRDASGWM